MEMKPGYRLTELGELPANWAVEPLGKYATFRTGPFGSALHKSDYSKDGVPVINPTHIINGRLDPTPTMTIKEHVAMRLSDFRMKAGEIVIGRRGDMGRCAVVQPHQSGWLCGTGSMIVRSHAADGAFLQRVLSSPRAISAIEDASVGTTMVNLNQATLSCLKIQIPPLPEQQAIVSVLGDVDALLDGLDRLIAKKRDLKQAAMQQLLTGQTRLPGFSGEWGSSQFDEIARIRNEKVISSFCPSGTRCVELDAIKQGRGRLIGWDEAKGYSSKYVFKSGDVLFGRLRAYLRKYWFADFDGICSTEIWPLIPRDARLSSKYLYLIVQTDSFYDFAGISYGTHMPRSDWSALGKLVVRLPAYGEQVAIAEIVFDMDAELTALEARRNKTQALKQAMMQELLTGRIRLVDPEPKAELHA
jgi:type I restriction enzyme, S subunit